MLSLDAEPTLRSPGYVTDRNPLKFPSSPVLDVLEQPAPAVVRLAASFPPPEPFQLAGGVDDCAIVSRIR